MKLSEIQLVSEIQALFPKPRNYDEIKEDIKKRGIQVSLTISTKNELVCGYTRYQIAQELGIEDVPVNEPKEFSSLNEMKRYAIKDNDLRRQMTDFERYEYVVKPLLEIEQEEAGKRQSQAGEQFGKGIAQTQDASKLSEGKSVDIVGELVGWSGDKVQRMKRISEKAAPEVKDKLNEGEITQAAALELVKLDCDEQRQIISKHRDVKDIKKVMRFKEKQEQRQQLADNSASLSIPDSVTLYHGKMQEEGKKINDNSVDLILTDPPYGGEYLHLWDELAIFAKRILKPSGFLITYSGQLHLPVVMWKLDQQLEHYWTISLIHSGNKQLINGRDIFCGWKPILIFVKPPLKLTGIRIDDIINGAGREKGLHEWQQAEGELSLLIETFSKQGAIVVDPFAGAGTTLLAAHGLGRMVVGIDDDEQNINIIKGRMNERKRRFACAPTV